jgi:hypothetical protein
MNNIEAGTNNLMKEFANWILSTLITKIEFLRSARTVVQNKCPKMYLI